MFPFVYTNCGINNGILASSFNFSIGLLSGILLKFRDHVISPIQHFPPHFVTDSFQFQIYTDSAEAKIPGVIDYLGTVIEVLSWSLVTFFKFFSFLFRTLPSFLFLNFEVHNCKNIT